MKIYVKAGLDGAHIGEKTEFYKKYIILYTHRRNSFQRQARKILFIIGRHKSFIQFVQMNKNMCFHGSN